MESLTTEKEETCEINQEEMQYINLIKNIINTGHVEVGRNGKTVSLFGASMRFSLKNGRIPILTTKKLAWKTCLKELLWFISGKTSNNILKEQGVHIWDGNASKEFLESRGLSHYANGELGPIYGHQWRHYNAKWIGDADYRNDDCCEKGIDQLQEIINQLKNPETRTSRRIIMTTWNPCQLSKMALPPCHIMCQFNVHGGNQLSCSLYQRSGDVGLGISFNIASYSFLTHLLAKHCGLEACEFVYFLGNVHIYDDHIDAMKEQILRKPFDFPKVEIKQLRENINDYQFEDFEVFNYNSHSQIKMIMRK